MTVDWDAVERAANDAFIWIRRDLAYKAPETHDDMLATKYPGVVLAYLQDALEPEGDADE